MNEEHENGVDVEDFFDGAEDHSAESHEEVIEVGEEATEKLTDETSAEEKPNVSITDLIDNADDADDEEEKPRGNGYVPEADHIKLRKRAQAAEEKVKEYESQTTHTDAENSGLEIDDDDYTTGKELKSIAAQIRSDAKADAKAEFEAAHVKDLVKAKTVKMTADHKVAAEQNPDYLEVIAAMSRIELSKAAKAEIRNADNAAETAYQIGCQVLNRKPVQKRTPANTPPNANNNNNDADGSEQTSEEIFDEMFSS